MIVISFSEHIIRIYSYHVSVDISRVILNTRKRTKSNYINSPDELRGLIPSFCVQYNMITAPWFAFGWTGIVRGFSHGFLSAKMIMTMLQRLRSSPSTTRRNDQPIVASPAEFHCCLRSSGDITFWDSFQWNCSAQLDNEARQHNAENSFGTHKKNR